LTPFGANQNSASPYLVSSELPKKFGKIKKKFVKVFARFSENVLYFCRPHPTSVVSIFMVAFFLSLFREKYKKNSEKIKKFDFY
jgi:hypothetical protein